MRMLGTDWHAVGVQEKASCDHMFIHCGGKRKPQALGAPSSPSVRSETTQGSIPDPSQPCPADTCLWYICPVSRADGALGVCGEVFVPSLMRV